MTWLCDKSCRGCVLPWSPLHAPPGGCLLPPPGGCLRGVLATENRIYGHYHIQVLGLVSKVQSYHGRQVRMIWALPDCGQKFGRFSWLQAQLSHNKEYHQRWRLYGQIVWQSRTWVAFEERIYVWYAAGGFLYGQTMQECFFVVILTWIDGWWHFAQWRSLKVLP